MSHFISGDYGYLKFKISWSFLIFLCKTVGMTAIVRWQKRNVGKNCIGGLACGASSFVLQPLLNRRVQLGNRMRAPKYESVKVRSRHRDLLETVHYNRLFPSLCVLSNKAQQMRHKHRLCYRWGWCGTAQVARVFRSYFWSPVTRNDGGGGGGGERGWGAASYETRNFKGFYVSIL